MESRSYIVRRILLIFYSLSLLGYEFKFNQRPANTQTCCDIKDTVAEQKVNFKDPIIVYYVSD